MLRRLTFWWLYRSRPPWDSGIPAPELVRALAEWERASGPRADAPRALDLGCGTGTNVRYLAERGWRATGLDFVARAISQARRKLQGQAPAATLLVADVTQLAELDLPGPYDLALDMGCYHSLPAAGRRRYVAGLRRWLKPGAPYLLYAFQPSANGGPGGLTREQVLAEFADGFTPTGYEQGQGRPSAWYYFRRQPTDG